MRYIHPLIAIGYLKMTLPDKPNSRLQKYVITQHGKIKLNKMNR